MHKCGFVDYDKNQIQNALNKACFDKEYINNVNKIVNPYGDRKPSKEFQKFLSINPNDNRWLTKKYLVNMKNLVIVPSSSDDETLEQEVLRFKDDGYNLYWIIGTKMYENKLYDSNKIKLREVEIDKVSKLYGLKVFNLNYNTSTLTNNDVNKMMPKFHPYSKMFHLKL